MTMTGLDLGRPVMMGRRGRHPRVVHQLAQVKSAGLLYPYVMACGYATSSVEMAGEEGRRCPRCWKGSECQCVTCGAVFPDEDAFQGHLTRGKCMGAMVVPVR